MLSRPDPASALATVYGRIAFGDRGTVIAAVSGGSDSLAMLLTLRYWQQRNHPGLTLLAVTIDHGLRPGSFQEACRVGEICDRLGVAHRILCWTGSKEPGGIAAKAREARYALLAQAAVEAGTDLVITGHTANDQAETVFMRQARGDGPGLAGMAPATLYDGRIWIARPLLAVRRAALRDVLRSAGLDWIEDPTNENPAHERVRARIELGRDPAAATSLLALARRRATKRMRDSALQAAQLERRARLAGPGLLHLDPRFADADHAGALRLLLGCCGGRSFLPGFEETRRLQLALAPGAGTLSRSVATRARGGLYLHRELRGLPEIDCDGDFDGRYRLRVPGWRLERRRAPAGDGLLERARAGVPVARGPDSHAPQPVPLLAPFERFLSGFDLDAAAAAARLFGRPAFPQAPLSCAEF